MGFEVEALELFSEEALRRPRRVAGGRRRGRRRDLRDRLRGDAAGAGRRGDRGDQPLRGAGRSPATSPPGSTPPAARSSASRSRPTSPSASTRRSWVTGSRRASGTPGSCGSRRSGSPMGRPSQPAAGTIDASVLGLAPRRGPRSTKFSSGQVVIAGGSRGLTGAVRMSSQAAIRAGAGYATVAVPADLEPIFEAGRPEVMSVGCPGGDGCLAPGFGQGPARRLRTGRGRRPRARTGPRSRLGRAGARGRRPDRGRRW